MIWVKLTLYFDAMKQRVLILLAAIATFTIVSCNKETDNQVTEKPDAGKTEKPVVTDGLVDMTFTASLDATESKATLSGNTVSWQETDHVAVYDGTARRDFTVKSITAGKAVLQGKVKEGSTEFYAIYPYSAASETLPSAEGVLSYTFPSAQTGVVGGADASALVSLAKAPGSGNLAFKNVASLLKIHVEAGVERVRLSGKAGENIAGTSASKVAEKATEGTEPEIVLTPSGSAFEAGDYCIGLLPTNFTAGFSIVFEKTVSSAAKKAFVSTDTAVDFERNGGKSATTATASLDWIGFPIMNEAELRNFAAHTALFGTADTIELGADIALSSAWAPFDLSCTLDGKDHKVSGLKVDAAEKAGFVSTLNAGAVMKNIEFTADGEALVKLTGTSGAQSAGIVAVNNGTITNVINRVPVWHFGKCQAYVGGIAGLLDNGGIVSHCDNYGTLSTGDGTAAGIPDGSADTWLGGIVGKVDTGSGLVEYCTNYGTVTSGQGKTKAVAGIAALVKAGKVSHCTNEGTLAPDYTHDADLSSWISGIVGRAQNMNAEADLIIENCVNKADINCSITYVTGVAGIVGQCHNEAVGTLWINDCDNLGDITLDVPDLNKLRMGAGIIAYVNGVTGIKQNVNRGNITVNAKNANIACAGIAAWVDKAGQTNTNYNFGDIAYAQTGVSTPNDKCAGSPIVACLALAEETEATFSMKNDRALGSIKGTGRVGGIYAIARSSAKNMKLTVTDPYLGCTLSGYWGSEVIDGLTPTDDETAKPYYFSYRKSGNGNTYNTPTVKYISLATAEAEVVELRK